MDGQFKHKCINEYDDFGTVFSKIKEHWLYRFERLGWIERFFAIWLLIRSLWELIVGDLIYFFITPQYNYRFMTAYMFFFLLPFVFWYGWAYYQNPKGSWTKINVQYFLSVMCHLHLRNTHHINCINAMADARMNKMVLVFMEDFPMFWL